MLMTNMSRRQFMERVAIGSGAAGLLVASVAKLAANPLGLPIGSQVWPTRSMLKDFPAFAKMLAGIGVTRLELCSPIGYGAEFASLANGKEVAKILADQGLKSESSHFTMGELRRSQEKSVEWAKEIGITQMITASLGDGNGGGHPTLDQVKRAADEYNQIATVAAKAGMQQGLHNEGFELSMVDGKRTYDLLFGLLRSEKGGRRIQPDRDCGREGWHAARSAQRGLRTLDGRWQADLRPVVRSPPIGKGRPTNTTRSRLWPRRLACSKVCTTRASNSRWSMASGPTTCCSVSSDRKRAADEYNQIATVAAKAGMQQGLHNEGFELSMVDGKRTYDLLFGLL